MRTFAHEPAIGRGTRHTGTSSMPLAPQAARASRRALGGDMDELHAIASRAMASGSPTDFSRVPASNGILQTKLTIGEPGDAFEQEADRVAEQTMRMPEGRLQRACACGGTCPSCKKAHQHEQTRVQAKPAAGGAAAKAAVPAGVSEVLASNGQALDGQTRDFMESRFARDFSRVRVHTGAAAEASSRALGARAYTVGNHLVFGANQYAPGTSEGKRLLAHELTHVLQQSANGGTAVIQRDLAIEPPRPAAEGVVLTPQQIADAITFNEGVLLTVPDSADVIEMIRDVIGVSPQPAVVDEDFVNGVVQWQASFGLPQDGKLGPRTARPLFREIGAEGVGRAEMARNPRYTPAGPINVARGGGGLRPAQMDMSAQFRSDPTNHVFPSCGEIRQDIQWDAAFRASSVASGNGPVPHAGFPAAHPAGRWIEDRNGNDTFRYGHRAAYAHPPGNQYLDTGGRPNQAFGHRFLGQDNPGGLVGFRGSWSFRLRAVDVCNSERLIAVSPTLVINWL
ncbi:MAG TPA: DUF4157 domain-containing protein [Telluria sp.]|nr:DUF4157 domain-containing protein [Telluria sp.]